jgi:hypothetical protein
LDPYCSLPGLALAYIFDPPWRLNDVAGSSCSHQAALPRFSTGL